MKPYNGSNGLKTGIIIDNQLYLVKTIPSTGYDKCSYGAYTEYISSHIFKLFGIDVQDTILGTFPHNGKYEPAVACKDFETDDLTFFEFKAIENSVILATDNERHDSIESTIEVIHNQEFLDPKIVLERFWDQFVIDALIGNYDRHNSNWGYLFSKDREVRKLAPVFDNASSLCNSLKEEKIVQILKSDNEFNNFIQIIPSSLTDLLHSMIVYSSFCDKPYSREYASSLNKVIDLYDHSKIESIITSVEGISDHRKEFFNRFISKRMEQILKPSQTKCKSQIFIEDKTSARFDQLTADTVDPLIKEYRKFYLERDLFEKRKVFSTRIDVEFTAYLIDQHIPTNKIKEFIKSNTPYYYTCDDYDGKIFSKARMFKRNNSQYRILTDNKQKELENIIKISPSLKRAYEPHSTLTR